mmetsp:Transcript_19178/g.35027  ORF Transcript_19178/g.35027 Transcript_19178/m.35027 type:complete len:230 (-) Transcript_19178:144-833(-)
MSYRSIEIKLKIENLPELSRTQSELDGLYKKLRLQAPDLELQKYLSLLRVIREAVSHKLIGILHQPQTSPFKEDSIAEGAKFADPDGCFIFTKITKAPLSSNARYEGLESQLKTVTELCDLAYDSGASPQEAFYSNASKVFSLVESSYQLRDEEVQKVQQFFDVFSLDLDAVSSGDTDSRTVGKGLMSRNLAKLLEDLGVLAGAERVISKCMPLKEMNSDNLTNSQTQA